jgi:hypothetical protein
VFNGVNEFKIEVIELSIPFIAKENKNAGKKTPNKAVIVICVHSFFWIENKLLKPIGNKTSAVIRILKEPTCIGVRLIKDFLIRINELPHINTRRTKSPQDVNFVFSCKPLNINLCQIVKKRNASGLKSVRQLFSQILFFRLRNCSIISGTMQRKLACKRTSLNVLLIFEQLLNSRMAKSRKIIFSRLLN